MPNGPDATPQAALMELLECQRVLEEIKEELDLVSDGLVESHDNLTRLRAVTNSARPPLRRAHLPRLQAEGSMKKSEVEALFDHWAAHERPLELFNAWDAFVATDLFAGHWIGGIFPRALFHLAQLRRRPPVIVSQRIIDLSRRWRGSRKSSKRRTP